MNRREIIAGAAALAAASAVPAAAQASAPGKAVTKAEVQMHTVVRDGRPVQVPRVVVTYVDGTETVVHDPLRFREAFASVYRDIVERGNDISIRLARDLSPEFIGLTFRQ